MTRSTCMPFGKYKNQPLNTIPEGYLVWLIEEVNLKPRLRSQVHEELLRRQGGYSTPEPAPKEPNGSGVREVVAGWFRKLALKHHPDRGGSDLAMQVLNDAHEELLRALEECGKR
jgi:hypothetical protein